MRSWLPRTTVAAVVEQEGRFLVVEEDIHGRLILNQPAGHLEPGETLIEAAARETFEETGWHIEPVHLIEFSQWTSPNSKNHYLRACFAGRVLSHDPEATLDVGIVRALWLSRDEIAQRADALRSPLVLRHIDQYIKGKRYDLDVFSYCD